MAFEFHLPDIGEGVIEGEIVSWKVAEGQEIGLDQPLVEIMTDKATVEIPSPRHGVIAKIRFQEGEICPVGDVLVVIEEAHAAATEIRGNGSAETRPPAAPASESPEPAAGATIAVVDATPGRRVLATPATRKVARELGVSLEAVAATGKRGRVTTEDVRRHAGAASAGQRPGQPPAAAETSPAVAPAYPVEPRSEGDGGVERIPFRGVRKAIARNMKRSVTSAAHFTLVEEIDMTELVRLRERLQERAAERGLKVTFLPFIIKAVTSGLKKFPQLNAHYDEAADEIVRKKFYHIGIAAQGPEGLMVTVVRDADRRSIYGIAEEIARLADAVAAGTTTREDLVGSTFTITSLGKLGGVMATPILNYPEIGIVGVHQISQKPAVVAGEIQIRWLMNLSISLDHCIVDGWDGAVFLQEVKNLLEDPTRMFMEMV